MRHQRSIARTVSVNGFGYWSGEDVRVEFRPAAPDTGIVFVRADLTPPIRIAAAVGHRIEIPRRTTLTAGGQVVEMVEHVLAACAGLWIDNCEIWTTRSEMPGFDGSSQPFVTALWEAGPTEQNVTRQQLIVRDVIRVGDQEAWIEASPSDGAGMSLEYQLDYGPHTAVGSQQIQLEVDPHTFCSQLASARTFLLQQEAEWLRSRGLGQRVTYKDLLVFGPDGPLHNTLRFPDECVRHKALDVVGDFALANCDLVGRFVAYRSGHRLNAELVRTLLARSQGTVEKRKSA